jgi:transcriptional regulator with XRE-family HTH domain
MDEDTIIDVALGDNIRALRERRGMTPKTLAKRMGVTVQSVSQWETNKYKPGQKNREKLCDFLGVTLDELASRRLPTETSGTPPETIADQKGANMVEKDTSLTAIRVVISILRPDLALDDAQALAAVFLSLALTPPDPASGATYEDQLRSRFQGALAARSVQQ